MEEEQDISDYLNQVKAKKAAELLREQQEDLKQVEAMRAEHDYLESEALKSSKSAAKMALKIQDTGVNAASELSSQGKNLDQSENITSSTVKSAQESAGLAKDVEKYSHFLGIKFKNPFSHSRKERLHEKDVYKAQISELSQKRAELERDTKRNITKGGKDIQDRLVHPSHHLDKEESTEDTVQIKTPEQEIDENLDTIDKAIDNILVINQDMTAELNRQKVVMEQIEVHEKHIQFNINHAEKKIKKYT